MTEENNFLSINEAVQYAKITRAAIYIALKKGKLHAVKKKGLWQFTTQDLDAYRISKYNRDDRSFNGEKIFSPEKGTFSITQASKILSYELKRAYSRHRLYYLIRRGEVKTSRFGCSFIIKKEDLIALIEKERGFTEQSRFA